MTAEFEGITPEQMESLRNPFPGLDVDAVLEQVNATADIDRGELCAVLAQLQAQGRLLTGEVGKQYATARKGLSMTHMFRIFPGEELLRAIETSASEFVLPDASLTLVGAVATAVISTMDRDGKDIEGHYQGPMELSGTGSIIGGRAHVHATLGLTGNVPVFGHLHRAVVGDFFVDVTVAPVDAMEV